MAMERLSWIICTSLICMSSLAVNHKLWLVKLHEVHTPHGRKRKGHCKSMESYSGLVSIPWWSISILMGGFSYRIAMPPSLKARARGVTACCSGHVNCENQILFPIIRFQPNLTSLRHSFLTITIIKTTKWKASLHWLSLTVSFAKIWLMFMFVFFKLLFYTVKGYAKIWKQWLFSALLFFQGYNNTSFCSPYWFGVDFMLDNLSGVTIPICLSWEPWFVMVGREAVWS